MVLKQMPSQSRSYDIIIIGAGPGGSTAAYLLARHNFKVVLVDKEVFPRYKLCGGLLSMKTIQLIKRIYKESPEDLMDAIIALDELYKAGDIPEGAYHERRADLKARLRELMGS